MKLKKMMLPIVMMLLCAMISACGSASNTGGNGNKAEGGAKTGESWPGAAEGQAEIDPMGKYDPPIELTTIRSLSPNQYYDEGETIDNNAIYDYYEQKYGIKVINKWTVTNEYESKLKIAIASNDVPDFYRVTVAELQQLIDNDMIMDLTDLWEQYASGTTKQEFTKDGGRQLKTATFNGKLMAIPQTNSPYNDMGFLWVRQDWLEELGLPEPQTIADMEAISKAFAARDTQGKGKAYGLMLSKDLNLGSYFSGFGLYPSQWVKNEAGELEYGALNPAIKPALQRLQTMFKEGQIDPEFGVKDDTKALELALNGQVGIFYGSFWHSAVLFEGAVKDGKVVQNWRAYPIPTVDGEPALHPVSAAVSNFYVVNKKAKHPEAVLKLLNEWIEVQTNPNPDNKVLVFGKDKVDKGQFFYEINPVIVFSQDEIVMSGELIPRALATQDPSILGEHIDRLARYESVRQYNEGIVTGPNWLQHMIAGEGGTMSMMYDAYENNFFHFNDFYGAPTPTMGDKGSILKAKEKEIMTKIIMGSVALDEYDSFIAEWKRLGGDKMTAEVNAWYETVK